MSSSTRPAFRDSAAVVLVRGDGEQRETFWVRRSELVSYMPGFRAFVGGKVAAEDERLPVTGAVDDAARVLVACAIRETFEETGVVIGLAPDAPGPGAPSATTPDRERLLAGEVTFDEIAKARGWRFDARALTFAGRWQTPPFTSMRFDTTFFLARIGESETPRVLAGELDEGAWVRPLDAIERWRHGEETFAAPILWTLIALAEGEEGLAERLARGPERAGTPIRRIELKWGIVLHPMVTRPLPPATHTNAYLVGEREMVLIDPGSGDPDELEHLAQLVSSLEAEGRRLTLIVATHAHPDHTGGIEAMRARFRVRVAAHPFTAPSVRADIALADGDWIPLTAGLGDWNLRVVHTPGHARGHICLLHPRTRSLFTGDHIPGGRGTVIIDPPEGDMTDYVRSLERLLAEPVETLFPAHGSPQGGAMRRVRQLIDHRAGREARVREALSQAPGTLAELLPRVYADTKQALWPHAERSLLAHLLKLEREGLARRDGERWRPADAGEDPVVRRSGSRA